MLPFLGLIPLCGGGSDCGGDGRVPAPAPSSARCSSLCRARAVCAKGLRGQRVSPAPPPAPEPLVSGSPLCSSPNGRAAAGSRSSPRDGSSGYCLRRLCHEEPNAAGSRGLSHVAVPGAGGLATPSCYGWPVCR